MYDLNRFLTAQSRDYTTALREIRSGRKRSHWIWYIFPQVAGLGMSSTSQYYAISGLDEARAYLREPTLRAHLLEVSNALLELDESDPSAVFGFPDDLKLRSSMTLFAAAAPDEPVFAAVLDKFRRAARHAHTADPRPVRRHTMDNLTETKLTSEKSTAAAFWTSTATPCVCPTAALRRVNCRATWARYASCRCWTTAA